MIIRNGEYTKYANYDFALFEARQEAPIPFTHFILKWYCNEDCPLDDFEINQHRDTIKVFERNTIVNAYKVSTFALFCDFKLRVYNYFDEQNALGVTSNVKIDDSRFLKSIDQFGMEVYIGMIDLNEIDEIWEERSQSRFDLTMPNEIHKKKVLNDKI